jgi:hypothetical protein
MIGLTMPLRLVGKLSPEGNGLMTALEIGGGAMGAAHGGPVEAGMAMTVPVIGWGAKRLADNMTASRVQTLSDLLRSGGDASALQAPPNAVQQFAQSKRELLARALMNEGVTNAPGWQSRLAQALGFVGGNGNPQGNYSQ